ncbi:hypothetical protein QL995_17360 [Pseudoalteromonas sp. APC 3358]|uniref:hypothetical protein n=1 Tax=unclassified Pseudoalteromonas TaxID=194690 RepID=UPI00040D40DB|nr:MULTISPECIES: hypothetical protein [unclassified Pseudoalteromonas]MDN3384404.1 hypothetical protein [Pseudoalteromonas sp. APC 3358]
MLLNFIRKLFNKPAANTVQVENKINYQEETSSIAEPVPFNEKLYEHFSKLSMHDGQLPLHLYHGGAHKPGLPVKGTLWLSDNYDEAYSYANFGSSYIRDLEPIVFKAQPKKNLKLLSFPGNHVEILKEIYGGAWSHSQLHKDIVQIYNVGKIDFDGFYRPCTNEYFIINVEENLGFIEE